MSLASSHLRASLHPPPDGASQLGAQAPMGSFLMGTGVFMDASEPRFMKLEWTNEEGSTYELKIPNRPSSETQMSVVLPYSIRSGARSERG